MEVLSRPSRWSGLHTSYPAEGRSCQTNPIGERGRSPYEENRAKQSQWAVTAVGNKCFAAEGLRKIQLKSGGGETNPIRTESSAIGTLRSKRAKQSQFQPGPLWTSSGKAPASAGPSCQTKPIGPSATGNAGRQAGVAAAVAGGECAKQSQFAPGAMLRQVPCGKGVTMNWRRRRHRQNKAN